MLRAGTAAIVPTSLRSSGWTGTSAFVDARLLRSPEGFAGDPQKFPDWRSMLTCYLGAIDERYRSLIAATEQATTPILNAGLSGDGAQLSTQLYYVLTVLNSGEALDKCR